MPFSDWNSPKAPSRPTRRRLRLRKEFEDSVVASRFEDGLPGKYEGPPHASVQPASFPAAFSAVPDRWRAQAGRSLNAHKPAPSGFRIAAWISAAVVVAFAAWAVTVMLARLVWRLSGS